MTLSKLSLNPWVERQLGAGCKDEGSASQGWKQMQCLWAAGGREVCGLEECGQAGGTCGRTTDPGSWPPSGGSIKGRAEFILAPLKVHLAPIMISV